MTVELGLVASGRVGSGRVGSGRVGSGRVGSGPDGLPIGYESSAAPYPDCSRYATLLCNWHASTGMLECRGGENQAVPDDLRSSQRCQLVQLNARREKQLHVCNAYRLLY